MRVAQAADRESGHAATSGKANVEFAQLSGDLERNQLAARSSRPHARDPRKAAAAAPRDQPDGHIGGSLQVELHTHHVGESMRLGAQSLWVPERYL